MATQTLTTFSGMAARIVGESDGRPVFEPLIKESFMQGNLWPSLSMKIDRRLAHASAAWQTFKA